MRVRLLLFIALLLVAVVTLFLLLLATDTAMSVWQRLREAPLWLQVAYTLILVAISSGTLWLSWLWLKPGKKKSPAENKNLDPLSLQEDLVESASAGVDVSAAVAEIKEQQRRKQTGEVFIALFGEISTGKSSLVKALLPGADMDSDPRGGTTRQVSHYRWQADSGDIVIIADLPGFNLESDPEILEEARRSHLVVFLCDSDITRSHKEHLESLLAIQKPQVVALNKVDRCSASEARAIANNISERTAVEQRAIVYVQTGGHEEVIK